MKGFRSIISETMTKEEITQLGRDSLTAMQTDLKNMHGLDFEPNLSIKVCYEWGQKMILSRAKEQEDRIKAEKDWQNELAAMEPEERNYALASLAMQQKYGDFS